MSQKNISEFLKNPNDSLKKPEVIQSNFRKIYENISRIEWKQLPYKKQNWGIWLHNMSAYVGKLKPAMAHLILKYSMNKGDVVLDPFCGVGTVSIETELLGGTPIANDLSPYAFYITKAKFDRQEKNKLIQWIQKQEITLEDEINWLEKQFVHYYHPKTLKEISFYRKRIFEEEQWFILGCLLGILHGHRPGHLSAITSLVIPYEPKSEPIYKEVKPRIIEKIKRMYRNPFPDKTDATVLNEDTRNLVSVKEDSVDLIVSSPPYFNTLDYVEDNRLRLNFLGYKTEERNKLKNELIQSYTNYLDEMKKVGLELQRVLKPKKLCILILGDHLSGKKLVNTAEEIEKLYTEMGFITHGIIDDWMPTNRSIPSNHKRKKLDRILILENAK